MTISLFLDITIAVLLVLTIGYAVRLNGRLAQLRNDKAELEKLARIFAEATERAEDGTRKLTVSTDALKAEVEKAEVLKDDLAYLVERGAMTADEMVEKSRSKARPRINLNSGGFSDEDIAGPATGESDDVGRFANNGDDELLRQAIAHGRMHVDAPASHKATRSASTGRRISPEADAERVLMKVLGSAN